MLCLNNTDTLEGGASVDAVVDYTVHGFVGTTFMNIIQGQLSNTDPSVLYTAGATVNIMSIILVNTHTAAVMVNLYLDPTNVGTPRRLIPKNLSLRAGYSMVFDGARVMVLNTDGQILQKLSSGGVDTSGTPIVNDIARFTDTAIIEGRSYAEFKSDLNLEIGTDVLAQQTIGIANDNLLEVDGTPLDTEVAVFTAAGINGLSESEFKAAFNLEIGTDVLAQQTIGIADDNLLEVDQADAANGEYTRMTANGIESRSKLETQADLCVPIDASNTDVDTGTETVDSFADTTGDVCFWFVKVKKGANVRAQIFMANWDASGDTIEYSQGQTTLDVGDTSDLVLSADIDSNNIRLRATAGSDDWEVTVKRMVV